MSTVTPAAVIVLAAGEGTRMKSRTPKILHNLGGRSLLAHAITAAQGTSPQRIALVVRHERDQVVAHAQEFAPNVLIADQDEIPGTGRAVQCGLEVLDAAAQAQYALDGVAESDIGADAGRLQGPVIVQAGDIPLLDSATLQHLLRSHTETGDAVTVLTTRVPDPTGYGRIVRDATGAVIGIVEHRDATEAQRNIDEINSSVYVFDADILRTALSEVTNDNAQGEIYLTDVLAIARQRGLGVGAVVAEDPMLVEGVNDRRQLSILGAELNRRTLDHWMLEGVTIVDPASTWIDVTVTLEPDVTIYPGTQLHGQTIVRSGAHVGPDTTLYSVHVGPAAVVTRTHGSDSSIGADSSVGPFSFLRPGTIIGVGAKVGAYVETKNSQIGDGSKVPHLSYVGDATIGENSNVGAGTIFVNYDGVRKSHSTVGSHVRIGSDNLLIAPVTINDGAYTGAGSVIRRDVPAGALAVSSGAQRNIEGWVARRRPNTPSAEAAALANGDTGEVHAIPATQLSPQAQYERQQAEVASSAIPQPPAHMLNPLKEQDK